MLVNPESKLVIIPVGLNYFHADQFRSRAVIEYGEPISIPTELVNQYAEGGLKKRQAVGALLDTIEVNLKSLSLQAPDFETLMVIQAVNRLYVNDEKLDIDASLRISRRFAHAFQQMREKPEIKHLIEAVKHYNQMLSYYGVKDHQVKNTSINPPRAFLLLIYRIMQFLVLFTFAAPMLILGSPLLYLAHNISKIKMIEAKAGSSVKILGKDVVTTWKLLTSLAVIPALWIGYSVC